MELTLTAPQQELRDRARRYVEDHLQPLEGGFERDGRLPDDVVADLKRVAIDLRLHGGSLPVDAGGQGWSALEQVLVHEQLGQATGGLWSFIPGAYNALIHCTPDETAAACRYDRLAHRTSPDRRLDDWTRPLLHVLPLAT